MATSILQGLGSLGSHIGGGYEILRQQKAQEAEQQLRQLMARSQLMELQERIRQSQMTKLHGTFSTSDGSVYAVTTDPQTGQPKPQLMYKSQYGQDIPKDLEGIIAQVPEDKRALLQSMIKPYIDTRDYKKAIDIATAYASKLSTEKAARPFSPEEQEIEAARRERKEKGLPDLSSEELRELHKRYQPYGQERVNIALQGLGERTRQDITRDLDAANKRLQPIDELKGLMDRALPGVDNPSGPGDVELLSAFVAATKPPVGFRWTQQEVNMITQARSVLGNVEALKNRLLTGQRFSADQRRLIGNTVRTLSDKLSERRKLLVKAYSTARPELAPLLKEGDDMSPTPPSGTLDPAVKEWLEKHGVQP